MMYYLIILMNQIF